jgi:hypothetical protein
VVGPAELVEGLAEVPEGAAVDPLALQAEAPQGPGEEWQVGIRCVACWSEDLVWNRAEVSEVLEGNGLFSVYFIDYGNSAKVARGDMVAGRVAIPVGQVVDHHVEQEPAWWVGAACMAL